MSKATDRTRTYQPVSLEQMKRQVRPHRISKAIAKAYDGNTRALCDELRSSGEYHDEALAEFIARRSNGANKEPPDPERLVAAMARSQLKQLRSCNGGKPLPRGTPDRVIRRIVAQLAEDREVPWALVTEERMKQLTSDTGEMRMELLEHDERIERIKTAVGRGRKRNA